MSFSDWLTPWIQSSLALDTLLSTGLTPAQIADRQARRLNALVRKARRESPFYRDVLGHLPDDLPTGIAALTSLPPMSRHTLMDHFDQWSTDPRISLSEVKRFTAEERNIGSPFLDRYTVWESSGTHGEPGYFLQDAQAMAVYDALEGLRRSHDGDLIPFGLHQRIAFVGALGGHFASYVSIQRLRRLNPWLAARINSFSIMQRTDSLVAALNAFDPGVIATYPTAAAMLADQARAGRLRTRPNQVWTGGETLTDTVRRHVESSLDCVVRNSYGASEFLTIGWECDLGQLHANSDWLVLEPVDGQFHPVAPGAEPATTLLTNLANHVQPLIRYDVGDKVIQHTERCACGSPLPVIEVRGRDDDSMVMAGNRADTTVTVLPLALMTALEEDAGVFDFQIFQQDTRTLAIRLPGRGPSETRQLMQRCRKALQKFSASQGLAPIRLVSQPDEAIAHGNSGKIRRIVACDRVS